MAKTITTIKKIATLGKRELRYTEMDGVQKFDIRAWHGDKYEDGVRFTEEEMKQLYQRMKSNLPTDLIGNKSLTFDLNNGDEYALSIVNNGRLYVRPFATKSEMDKLMQILEVARDNLLEYDDKACASSSNVSKKRGRPGKKSVSVTDVQTEDKTKEEKPKNIIQFPKKKPDVEKIVTDGHATYEDCETKLGEYKKIYVDDDSQYVLNGLLELCLVDQAFRNNVMREDKNWDGVMSYMAKMCRDGYGYKKGTQFGYVSADMGLGFAIDYFNTKNEPKAETKVLNTNPKSDPKKKEKAI